MLAAFVTEIIKDPERSQIVELFVLRNPELLTHRLDLLAHCLRPVLVPGLLRTRLTAQLFEHFRRMSSNALAVLDNHGISPHFPGKLIRIVGFQPDRVSADTVLLTRQGFLLTSETQLHSMVFQQVGRQLIYFLYGVASLPASDIRVGLHGT